MLKFVCDACLIRKTRHYAAYAGVKWEIDEYKAHCPERSWRKSNWNAKIKP